MYLSFAHPEYLFFLILLPLLVLIHFISLNNSKKRALKFANFDAIARVKGVDLYSKNITILSLSVIIIFLLTLVISGLTLHTEAEASSFSFVLAIDSSRSMQADDLPPTRLEAAKQFALDFTDLSPSWTRIGVISFSGNSFIYQDMTDNKDEIRASINNIEISDIEGTDIKEAIMTSTNMLIKEEAPAVIILTDGQENAGGINDSIDYANNNGIIVDTIAMGTEAGGNASYGLSKVNEDFLKALAFNTNGVFSRAIDKQSLSDSMQQIMKLTKKKVSVDLSRYILIALIIIFILEYILISTRYRAFP